MTTLFENETEAPMSTLVEQPAAQLPVVHDITPIQILQTAVELGRNADELGKLMDLQERWERNQAERQFNSAMHACQQEMPKVIKSAENTQTGSSYANLESVQAVARPVYAAHGFSLCYGESDCPVAGFKRTTCDVRHVGGHCSQFHLDLPIDGVGAKGNAIGAMNPVQACISTTSYGQRRLLCMIFNITLSGEDDDGQSQGTIDEEQIAIINEWLITTDTNLSAFLKWGKCKSLDKFKTSKFDEAIEFFKRRQKQQQGGGR